MSNLNINRNTSDPSDNDVFRSSSTAPQIILALGPLIWRIGLVFGAIWLLGILINSTWCSLEPYNCFDMKVVIGWLPALFLGFGIIAAAYISAIAIQDYKNRAFLGYNEPKIHRDTLTHQDNTNRIFDVAYQNVKSKATAGLDTNSPSTTWVSPKEKPLVLAQPEERDPDGDTGALHAISLDDIAQ